MGRRGQGFLINRLRADLARGQEHLAGRVALGHVEKMVVRSAPPLFGKYFTIHTYFVLHGPGRGVSYILLTGGGGFWGLWYTRPGLNGGPNS